MRRTAAAAAPETLDLAGGAPARYESARRRARDQKPACGVFRRQRGLLRRDDEPEALPGAERKSRASTLPRRTSTSQDRRMLVAATVDERQYAYMPCGTPAGRRRKQWSEAGRDDRREAQQ